MNNIYTLLILILLTLNLTSLNASRLLTDSVLSVTDSIDETPLPFAEEMAHFPGGNESLALFVSEYITYPKEAVDNEISGKVFVQFVVDTKGYIKNIKVIKGVGGGCNEEAIRIVKMFPRWIPAKDKGKLVSVTYTLPFTFSFEPLKSVDQMPEFPGGRGALQKYLSDHIEYPSRASQMDICGRVSCQFVVDRTGKIKDVTLIRGIGGGCDEEVIRVIKTFPDWIPGKDGGVVHSVYQNLTVKFISDDCMKDVIFNPSLRENYIFDKKFLPATFPGGMDSLASFFNQNLQLPKSGENNIRVVNVEFKVSKEGIVSKPKIIIKSKPEVDELIVKLVERMPVWNPATVSGEPENSTYRLQLFVNQSKNPVISPAGEFTKEPLIYVEEMPEFPGGSEALLYFLANNIKYPAVATESNISGRVVLQFVVTETGDITNVRVVRGIGGGCDEEAVRVVRMMPRWKPGYHDGFPVPVFYTLPVLFTLKDEIALPPSTKY